MELDLKALRAKIDGIDDQLVSLFEKRMEICDDIAEYKANSCGSVLDRSREDAIKERLTSGKTDIT